MNTIVVTSTKQNIKFGYEGEDNVTKIIFPYDESWLEYGEGNFEVRILRCGDEVAYTATEVVDDRQSMTLTMTVTDIELSVRGRGEMQLCYVCPDSIKKSPIYQYTVNRSVDYKYAVGLIKNNDDIKQKIRDGKYVIARKGNRVALIATDKEIIGYKQELTNFLQQQDNATISNVILSNVPVYNNGSHVLSFDKDKQDLSDDVLKIYFSVEDDKNISWFQDSKMAKLHSDIVKDVSKQLIEYCQSCGLGSKINVQTECSSDGIAPLLTGLLSAKQDDLKHYLLLCNSSISMSLTPRRALNGFKPEAIAKTVYELFQIAILNGYNVKNPDTAFVNLDMSSNDGSFEYHNIGSTNSFLKELGRLQAEHNRDCVDADKQTLLVAINDNIISATGDNKNLQSKKNTWFTGIKHQDILNNIRDNKDFYDGIQVRAMSDLADEINRKNTMQNNTAGISKNNKDGVLHTVNSDKTVNNSFVKSVVDDKTVQKI